MTTLEVKQDGKIYVIKDCPEKLDLHVDSSNSTGGVGNSVIIAAGKIRLYNQALDSCERIPVSNHNDAFFRIQDQYMPKGAKEFKLVPGIYQVDCEWEKEERQCADSGTDEMGRKVDFEWVAILKELPKEESQEAHKGHLQETQEAMWNYVDFLINDPALPPRSWSQKRKQLIMEFTITRKK